MNFFYLAALCLSLTCMVLVDRRFGLFFWAAPARAAAVTLIGLVFFVLWDLAGISVGIFFRGDSPYLSGVNVAPELPLEELFFLTFLCYLTMNLYTLLHRRAATGSFLLQPEVQRR